MNIAIIIIAISTARRDMGMLRRALEKVTGRRTGSGAHAAAVRLSLA
jgi:hypothetical protein